MSVIKTTSGRKSRYAAKKNAMHGGSYHGNSPFFENIPHFQYLKPLGPGVYPHLDAYGPNFRYPEDPWKRTKPKTEEEFEIPISSKQ